MSALHFIFRNANIDDIKQVHQMIQEFGNFTESPNAPQQTVEDLIRDSGLNGDAKLVHIYILEGQNVNSKSFTTIGYAICYIFYSSWIGKTYFLETIYIKPEYRKLGAGKRLLCEIARKSREIGCKRLGLNVAEWNPACKFFEKYEVQDNTVLEERHLFHVKEDKLVELAKQLEI